MIAARSIISAAGCFAVGIAIAFSSASADNAPSEAPAPMTAPTSQADSASPATDATTAPATQPAVTLINIHLKQAMPEDVFDEVAKQAGVRIIAPAGLWDQDSMQVPADIDLTNCPFWQAVTDLCQRWNLSLHVQNIGRATSPRIMLSGHMQMNRLGASGRQSSPPPTSQPAPPPQCFSGGFLVQATSMVRNQRIDFTDDNRSLNNVTLMMRVLVDPATHVLQISEGVHLQEAVDELGHSLLPPADASRNSFVGGYSGTERSLDFDCMAPLQIPIGVGKTIAHLQGYLNARVGDGSQTMEIDNPLTAGETDKTIGDYTIHFHSLQKKNHAYTVSIGIESQLGDEGSAYQMMSGCQLLDSTGTPFNSGGASGGTRGSGAVEYLMTFSQPPGNAGSGLADPTKWTLNVPVNVHSIRIPIDLRDIPIPGQ